MLLSTEGQLGPPPPFVFPAVPPGRSDDHPLLRLAARSSTRAQAAGVNPLDVLARAAERQPQAPRRGWGLAREQLPEFLLIGRICGERLRFPPEQFVGVPRFPWKIPSAVQLLVHSRGTIVDQAVVTCFGEIVKADLQGLIFTKFLDLDWEGPAGAQSSADWWTLKHYLNPRRTIEPPGPELFTWSSVFNNAKDLWPGVAGGEQIARLTPDQQVALANHCLGYGLEALAAESRDRYIRLAARRLIDLCARGLVHLHLTSEAYAALQHVARPNPEAVETLLPEEHGLAFLPDSTEQERRSTGTILIPTSWIAAAMTREIVALVHLVRLASFARDWYFGQLTGRAVVASRELRQSAELSLFDTAVARADGLAARFLDEAARYDNRIYGIQLHRDSYCRRIERRPHRFGGYDDPPERRSQGNDRGPGRGPDDDRSRTPWARGGP
jgi:hypothetical protein